MEQSNQKFSDLLSNRYKDLLKKEETILPDKPEQAGAPAKTETKRPPAELKKPFAEPDKPPVPASFPAAEAPSALAAAIAAAGQPSAEPAALHTSLHDKLRRFTDRVLSSHTYPSNQELALKLGFDKATFAALPAYKYELLLDPNACVYEKINLQSTDGRHLFYRKHYAADIFTSMFNSYIEERENFKADYFIDDMLFNLIFSETQSIFDLDSQVSPRKAIERITAKNGALEPSEQLLLNTYHSYAFLTKNDVTEENLFALHKILTKNMQQSPAQRYRTKELTASGTLRDIAVKAVAPALIDTQMKKLFAYIDASMNHTDPIEAFIASQIIHYYFIYISPYNEFNFTLARLLSSWYVIRHPDILYKPLFFSEALNRDRHTGKYLKAIKDSFDSGNDLTYFVNYLADIISAYSQAYIYLSKVISRSMADSIDLSRSEERAIKVILLFPPIGERYFDWKKFKAYDQTHFSKQYYNRLLNHLEQKGVLSSRSKASKLYRLNYEKFDIL